MPCNLVMFQIVASLLAFFGKIPHANSLCHLGQSRLPPLYVFRDHSARLFSLQWDNRVQILVARQGVVHRNWLYCLIPSASSPLEVTCYCLLSYVKTLGLGLMGMRFCIYWVGYVYKLQSIAKGYGFGLIDGLKALHVYENCENWAIKGKVTPKFFKTKSHWSLDNILDSLGEHK